MFFVCLFLGWSGAHKFIEKKTKIGLLYLCTLGLFGMGWIVDCVKYFTNKQFGLSVKKKRLKADEPLPTYGTNVILKSEESCHYSGKAEHRVVKNRVVGYNSGSAGVSVRVAKGVTVRTGGAKGAAIREDVAEKTQGIFVVTNQRIVFTSTKISLDKNLSALTSVIPYTNGFELQMGNNTYQFLTPEGEYICDIIKRVLGQ